MTRSMTNPLAAVSAVILALTSIGTIVAVPPAQAAVISMPVLV